MIYVVKIYTRMSEAEIKETGQRLKLWDVKLFKNYEYAVGAIISGDDRLYENLPEIYRTDFTHPQIVPLSVSSMQKIACELEFRYEDTGVVVYISEPYLEDDEEPETRCAKALKAAFDI